MEEVRGIVLIGVREAKQICRMGKGEKRCIFLAFNGVHFVCSKGIGRSTILNRSEPPEMYLPAKGQGGWEGCFHANKINLDDCAGGLQ